MGICVHKPIPEHNVILYVVYSYIASNHLEYVYTYVCIYSYSINQHLTHTLIQRHKLSNLLYQVEVQSF